MASNRWLGSASPVAQVDSIVIGGSWATSDTVTVTIGQKTCTYTVGGTTSTTTIASGLQTALAALTQQYYPEFFKITWAVNSSTITATAKTAGVPFTITVTKSSTSGTAVRSATTANSGPNDASVAKNWSTGATPASGDDLVFEGNTADCLYGLNLTAVDPASITVKQSYTGKIGLPVVNTSGSASYVEYLPTYLAFDGAGSITVTIGDGPGAGSGRIKIDTGGLTATVIVNGTGTPAETNLESFLWKGTDSSNTLTATRGSVGVAVFQGETATLSTIKIGQQKNAASDVSVRLSDGVTVSGAVEQNGGNLTTYASLGSTVTKWAGNLYLLGSAAVTGAVKNWGGNFYHGSSGTLGSTVANKGTYSRAFGAVSGATITGLVSLYPGSTWLDPLKKLTYTAGLKLVGCRVKDLGELDIGTDANLAVS